MKKWMEKAGLLFIVLLLAGCSGGTNNLSQQGAVPREGSASPAVMGRYVEETLSTKYEEAQPRGLFPVEGGIYLAELNGRDELLIPGEAGVEARIQDPGAFRSVAAGNFVADMAAAENGARMLSARERGSESGTGYRHYFLLADGQKREWSGFEGEEWYVDYWYGGDGYFYVGARDTASVGSGTALYRVDAQSGETEFLWEIPSAVDYVSACDDYLLVGVQNSVILYSLSDRERLPEDPVLSEKVENCREVYESGSAHTWLVCGSAEEEGIYLLTEEGLFYHVMYGSVMEQIIDGALCSISDISKHFAAFCVTEGGGGYLHGQMSGEMPMEMPAQVAGKMSMEVPGEMPVEPPGYLAGEPPVQMPVFWLAYDSGEVVRFVYDEEVSSVPDTMVRIYSLHDDYNIRQAVAGYQEKHPELYLKYETGVAENLGQTPEDALKKLAVQIASGEGPDVFVMDGLPYEAYAKKGVLKDLTELYETLRAGAHYFENVVDCFSREGGIYAIPAAFQVTVLMGEAARIKGVDSLEDFAALLEETEVENTSKAGLLTEERILRAMADVSGGWTGEDGALDREALGRFLEACRRIYLADRAEMGEEALQEEIVNRTDSIWVTEGGAAYDFKMGDKLYSQNALEESYAYYGNPLSVGSLGGDTARELTFLLAKLDYLGMDYRVMSHEEAVSCGGTACIPVSMLAVNSASGAGREAEDFVRYVLGGEFQGEAVLGGIPVNRDVLERAMEESGSVTSTRLGTYDSIISEVVVLSVEGISQEESLRFLEMLERIDGAVFRETPVYRAVMELGAAAVNGERSVEETVEAVEKKVWLYLAE